jgi:polar amino acid transport system substrate-binding protein
MLIRNKKSSHKSAKVGGATCGQRLIQKKDINKFNLLSRLITTAHLCLHVRLSERTIYTTLEMSYRNKELVMNHSTSLVTLLAACCLIFITACSPAPEPSPAATPNTAPTANGNTANTTENTTASAAAVTAADTTPACQLRLGFDAWEPYQYMGIAGKVTGLDIQLMETIASDMKCTLVMQQGPWSELIAQLREGQIDMLLGASKTPSRLEFAHFSDSYRQEKFSLYVLTTNDFAEFNTLANFVMAGHKVGIVSDYFYGEEFLSLSSLPASKDKFVEASMSELNLARLIDQDIQGFLEDSFVASSMLRRKGLDQQIKAQGVHLGDKEVSVMFSKKTVSEAQVQAFNAGLKQIRQDGRYDKILAEYQ